MASPGMIAFGGMAPLALDGCTNRMTITGGVPLREWMNPFGMDK